MSSRASRPCSPVESRAPARDQWRDGHREGKVRRHGSGARRPSARRGRAVPTPPRRTARHLRLRRPPVARAADLDLLVEFEDLPADAYAASYLGLEDLEVGGLPAGADWPARVVGRRSECRRAPRSLRSACAEKTTDSIRATRVLIPPPSVFTSSEAIRRNLVSYNLFTAEIPQDLIAEIVWTKVALH